jgi:HEXXH motif-containing protein
MMSDLTARVEAALKNPGDQPWFPELTTDLVDSGWQNMSHHAGLSPKNYGTARAMARNHSIPRRILARLPMFSDSDNPYRDLLVEILDSEFAHSYEEAGVKFYTAIEIDAANILPQLREAITRLNPIPTLFATVAALVRSIHVLDPADDAYDVSFSQPNIPFSIFVSVPQSNRITNSLRIAEAIIHEAMHLQLTLIERYVPLVIKTQKKIFSPWRGEYRSIQGVLHALYVFRVIDRFLECLLAMKSYPYEEVKYIQGRRDEIVEQINKIRTLRGHPELTLVGACFVNRLMQH